MLDVSGAEWRKSSRSTVSNCVEIAFIDGNIAVRNSNHPDGPILAFTFGEWDAFIEGVRSGELGTP
jgi:Domain of unknown function (DUF397)